MRRILPVVIASVVGFALGWVYRPTPRPDRDLTGVTVLTVSRPDGESHGVPIMAATRLAVYRVITPGRQTPPADAPRPGHWRVSLGDEPNRVTYFAVPE